MIAERRVVASYFYVSADGTPVAHVDRIEPGRDGRAKEFLPYLADGRGGFETTPGLGGVKLPLYHANEVAAATAAGELVLLVEGEGKCDALRAALRVARVRAAVTAVAGGANAALTTEHLALLDGASCLAVLADSDKPGRDATRDRSQAIARANSGTDVRVLDIYPDRTDGSDVADFLRDGGAVEDVLRLVEVAQQVSAIAGSPALVADLVTFIRRFVVISDEAALAVALWVLHTHAIDAADATPYLDIGSPQKQCGKTRLLEVLELLVARPWFTGRTSPAALVRKTAKDSPTLLLDETDAAFKGDKDYAQSLRGILDFGHRRGGVSSCCVGANYDVRDFPVFGPKALAGIGNELPDTVADRSIRISLERRLPGEPHERFRRKIVEPEALKLRDAAATFAADSIQRLRAALPQLPDALSDRAHDGWEPLLAIADLCGVGDDARRAAVVLCGAAPVEENHDLRTLRDVRGIFAERAADRLSSHELAAALRAVEDGPYGSLHGKDFDARALARRLKTFKVRPDTIRVADETRAKGYLRVWFEGSWARYLGPLPTPPDQSNHGTANTDLGKISVNMSPSVNADEAVAVHSPEEREQRERACPVRVSSVNADREPPPAIGEQDPAFTAFTLFTDIPEAGGSAPIDKPEQLLAHAKARLGTYRPEADDDRLVL